MKQLPLSIGFPAEPSLDDFVAGAANAQLLHSLRTLSLPGPPLYLWGPSGSGKTHLLHGVAGRGVAGHRVAWFDAGRPLPWPQDETAAMIVLDDVDRYDATRQHAAFALFVDATMRGVQVASGGRVPPIDLPLREDLRTRLGWGLVHAVQPLTDKDVRVALLSDAQRRGIALPAEVLDHLMTRHPRNLGLLLSLLDGLDAYAVSLGRAITVPLLKQMLTDGGVAA